jgi:hypothetical protein
MVIEARGKAVVVRLGARFAAPEVRRVSESLRSLAPVALVTLDFGAVREFDPAAIAPLAELLGSAGAARVRIRGLTAHQARLLEYFGLRDGERAPDPGGPAR